MLSTKVPLKCNKALRDKGKLPHPYFQYPYGVNPGDLEPLPLGDASYLPANSMAHYILLTIVPLLMGAIIFAFFLISSCFIVYGVIRGLYTDQMLPKRNKVLKKLGKLPEEKRRKHFRRVRKNKESMPGGKGSFIAGTAMRKSLYEPHLAVNPPNDTDYSSAEESSKRLQTRLSYTTPPLAIDKNSKLPTIPKPVEIPGQGRPFPVLPDAPLNKTREAGTSPKPKGQKVKKKVPKKPLDTTVVVEDEGPKPFRFPIPYDLQPYYREREEAAKAAAAAAGYGPGPERGAGRVANISWNRKQSVPAKETVAKLKASRKALKQSRLNSKSPDKSKKAQKKGNLAKVSPMPTTTEPDTNASAGIPGDQPGPGTVPPNPPKNVKPQKPKWDGATR